MINAGHSLVAEPAARSDYCISISISLHVLARIRGSQLEFRQVRSTLFTGLNGAQECVGKVRDLFLMFHSL